LLIILGGFAVSWIGTISCAGKFKNMKDNWCTTEWESGIANRFKLENATDGDLNNKQNDRCFHLAFTKLGRLW
jgi:hypothetical protein